MHKFFKLMKLVNLMDLQHRFKVSITVAIWGCRACWSWRASRNCWAVAHKFFLLWAVTYAISLFGAVAIRTCNRFWACWAVAIWALNWLWAVAL